LRLLYFILDLLDVAPLIHHDYDNLEAFGGHSVSNQQLRLALAAASHYMNLLYTGKIIETIFYL